MPDNSKKKPYTYERSWNYVLWLLSRRAYTRAQLRNKLERKEATPEVIDRVITRLEELNFVDDEAFATMYVRSRQQKKGRIALRQELFQKGVPEEIVDKVVDKLETPTQIEAALAVLEREAWRFDKDDPRKNRAKAYAFLARRGFTGEVVSEALERSSLFDET